MNIPSDVQGGKNAWVRSWYTYLRGRHGTQVALFIVFRFKKRITQRNLLNPPHTRIINKLRIDIKKHGHIHRLPRIQPLLLEAETLDLGEIRRYLAWRHAVGCYTDYVVFAAVCGCVEGEGGFPREDPHFPLLGDEFPGEDVGDGAVEGYADALGGGYGVEAGGGIGGGGVGAVGGGFYWLAAPAGGLADHFIHGHGAVGEGRCT